MVNNIPTIMTVMIVIAIILICVALLFWKMQKERKIEKIEANKRNTFLAQFTVGIIIAIAAAIFMFDGDILGENTSGISTIIGIVGISLIATSNVYLLPKRK